MSDNWETHMKLEEFWTTCVPIPTKKLLNLITCLEIREPTSKLVFGVLTDHLN